MRWNPHSELEGKHAFLSASKYHWIRYEDDKLVRSFATQLAAMRGTKLHELAAELIKMGIKLPKVNKTLNLYVNDAIGFRMSPEVKVYYSRNAFGTIDAVSYRNGKLRIHDLKTGEHEASMDQLLVYTGFVILEYGLNLREVSVELRIYQNDQVVVHNPDIDEIAHVIDRIKTADRVIESLREEEDL